MRHYRHRSRILEHEAHLRRLKADVYRQGDGANTNQAEVADD